MCGGGVGGVGCLKTLRLDTLSTRRTYVWGGVGGVFKDFVVGIAERRTYAWGGVGWGV